MAYRPLESTIPQSHPSVERITAFGLQGYGPRGSLFPRLGRHRRNAPCGVDLGMIPAFTELPAGYAHRLRDLGYVPACAGGWNIAPDRTKRQWL